MKLYIILLITVLVLCFFGCSKKDSNQRQYNTNEIGDCANDTGGYFSYLTISADIFSKQDLFERIRPWMVQDVMSPQVSRL